uniref:Ribosomal protein L23 n=1 Tax=Phaeophyceae sp. TaxID=2249243 RepID=A0A8E5FAP4_9PHAE|nr:ribosomal protein L23 [Phaeophyceae sp.]
MIKMELNSSIDLIKYPLNTTKAKGLISKNQYTFLVDPRLTKINIKKAIEFLFDIKIIKINSCNLPIKRRRVRKSIGIKSRYKKVIIKVAKNQKINFLSFTSEMRTIEKGG